MKIVSLFLVSLLIVSCSTVPLTGRKQFKVVPSSQMLALSSSSYEQVLTESKLSENQEYNRLVTSAGQRISKAVETYFRENGLEGEIKNYDWEFHVIESEEQNAWCMPGGKIAFYEGIMPVCKDETGVAVVMAHEIAHAVAGHGNERLSQQLALQMGGMALTEALEKEKEQTQQLALLAFGVGSQLGMMLPYSRLHENEADEMGLYFMAMAGYDPREAVAFWTRMNDANQAAMPEFLSTHPHSDTRIKNIEKIMPKAIELYNKHK